MTKRISRLVVEVATEVHAELKEKYGSKWSTWIRDLVKLRVDQTRWNRKVESDDEE